MVLVLSYILRKSGLCEYREIVACIERLLDTHEVSSVIAPNNRIKTFSAHYSEHMQDTLYITTKEASGYGILSNFSQFVCRMLKDQYPPRMFRIDLQFQLFENKSGDQAVIQQLTDGNLHVLIVWEYKPKVPSSLSDTTAWHLSETLLQAYYLRKSNSHPVLHCLTDFIIFS